MLPRCVFMDRMPLQSAWLLAFMFRRSSRNGWCFPSYTDIKANTGIRTNATVAKHLEALEKLGWIAEKRKRYHTSTMYRLQIPLRFQKESRVMEAPNVIKLIESQSSSVELSFQKSKFK